MAVAKPIHEIEDQLSQLVAEVEASGEEVLITRHGRVVAVLMPPPPSGVVFGAGARDGVRAPDLDELREHLPHLHRDPFDRLLITQARHEGWVIVTADADVAVYEVECLW